MSQQDENESVRQRQANARRTALMLGGIAVLLFLLPFILHLLVR